MEKEKIKKILNNLKKIHLESGSKDEYGHGLYNGLELARLVLLEEITKKNTFISFKEYKNETDM